MENGRSAWLVFGLTGQVGQALHAAIHAGDPALLAVSREPPPGDGRVAWHRGSLEAFVAPAQPIDAIASLGPLDAFASWFEASSLAPARVVALGSTSVHGKKDSPDPAERALAGTLRDAERRLAAAAEVRGSALTLLRPTLIYGHGRDRNLSRLVCLARRWRVLPLPLRAGGLRQPVHVEDVATAVLGALRSRSACPGFFDLPGGETLAFDEMVRRSLAAGAPSATLVRLPGPVFRTGVGILRGLGRLDAAGEGVLARLDRDLAYDAAPARIALGHYPRGFQPNAETFPA
ncbi:MAG: nucleoside-diphosphate sugar epimerase [Arenimonas sp.]|nr:nucleoside-diphosphate sugar epimerase [Arenimonas sp.]